MSVTEADADRIARLEAALSGLRQVQQEYEDLAIEAAERVRVVADELRTLKYPDAPARDDAARCEHGDVQRTLMCPLCLSSHVAVRASEPVTDHVATMVCTQCGKAWLEDLTSDELDRLATRADDDPVSGVLRKSQS